MTLICQIFRNNKPLLKYRTDRKLKLSAVFIFEIKGVNKDKMFDFLKGRFSVMGGPMDFVFGLFSDNYVSLLKSITSQVFSRYSKSYNNLNVKSFLKLKGPWQRDGPSWVHQIQLYKCSLEWSWWTLWSL